MVCGPFCSSRVMLPKVTVMVSMVLSLFTVITRVPFKVSTLLALPEKIVLREAVVFVLQFFKQRRSQFNRGFAQVE